MLELPTTHDVDLDRAVINFRKELMEWDPESPPLLLPKDIQERLYSVAYLYYQNGLYEDGEALFHFITLTAPDDRKSWFGLAACQQLLGAVGEAILSYTYLSLHDPSDPTPFIHSAECFLAQGERDLGLQSLEVADKLLALNPQHLHLLVKVEALKDAWAEPVAIEGT